MAGNKLPPRQKMIGMMYLVLTALLALNVSKDILDAFIIVNDGLEKTAVNFKDKIDDLVFQDRRPELLHGVRIATEIFHHHLFLAGITLGFRHHGTVQVFLIGFDGVGATDFSQQVADVVAN